VAKDPRPSCCAHLSHIDVVLDCHRQAGEQTVFDDSAAARRNGSRAKLMKACRTGSVASTRAHTASARSVALIQPCAAVPRAPRQSNPAARARRPSCAIWRAWIEGCAWTYVRHVEASEPGQCRQLRPHQWHEVPRLTDWQLDTCRVGEKPLNVLGCDVHQATATLAPDNACRKSSDEPTQPTMPPCATIMSSVAW